MNQIANFYRTLHQDWGSQNWWPAETAFEVVLGTILTQNTAWTNVERALSNLRAKGKLSIEGIRETPLDELEQLIRPAGYFRQKSARLKMFVAFLDARYGGSLERVFSQPTVALRAELLALNGIGPETADSILLYAGNHEIFVVDAYTRRLFERHGFVAEKARYDEIREMVEEALLSPPPFATCEVGNLAQRPACHEPSAVSAAARSELAQRFNEFHGLIVQLGKHYCLKTNPKCDACPLGRFLR
jgi:endonuclease-3 related protein